MARIVLAYSGGLETSVAIPWLAEREGAEIVTVTLDLGQGPELADVRERALAAGAVRAHVVDVREEFVTRHVLPALQAGAAQPNGSVLATALGRPLIARHVVKIAEMEGATAIAHGCSGTHDDQVRLELSARALRPGIRIVAPARVWGMSRTEAIDYARARGIAVPSGAGGPFRTDANLWGRSIAGAVVDDPWLEPPEQVYSLTRPPASSPDEPAHVEVAFDRGVPTKVNGVAMTPLELISSLETIAGAHGVGRIDSVEHRLVGPTSREICEAPAAVVLHAAHGALETMVIGSDLERLKAGLARVYADLVRNGLWFTTSREAIDAFVAAVQPRVTGAVRVRLFKGSCTVVGRQSPFSLDSHALPTDDVRHVPDHVSAEGFTRIWGLPVETAARHAPGSAAANRPTRATA
jgi:argininosuccinate synthase